MSNSNSTAEPETIILSHSRHAQDRFGRRKKWSRMDIWEKIFLIVSVLNILLCIALSVYRLVIVSQTNTSSSDFTFTILLIINSVFCLFYVIHGLFKELRFEIYIFIAAACFIVAYCVINFIIKNDHGAYKVTRLITACILGPISIALAVKVVRGFGYLEFEILGASSEMQKMFCHVAWFCSLIKFDLQITVSFLVLLLSSHSPIRNSDIFIMASGIPISTLWLIMGQISVRKEWKMLTVFFTLIGVLVPAYVLYAIVKTCTQLPPHIDSDKLTITVSTFIIGALLLVIRFIVYIELLLVYRNFGKGLRERAFQQEVDERSGLLAPS